LIRARRDSRESLIRANRGARERKFDARATKMRRLSPRKIRSRRAIVMRRSAARADDARASTAPEAPAPARAPHAGAIGGAIVDSRNRLQNKASPRTRDDDWRRDARATPRRAMKAAARAILRRRAFARRAKRRRRAIIRWTAMLRPSSRCGFACSVKKRS
jgi:hypothetical protein